MEFSANTSNQNKSTYQQKKLFWQLLKSVSRSFYLSLRYLPDAIRQPLSLAYLLARLTDTIADCGVISPLLRADMILQLKALIREPANASLLMEFKQYILPGQMPITEQNLLENISFIFELLNKQSLNNQLYIQDVLDKITEGQLIDLRYFDNKNGIVHFSTEQELDNYLYLVAGCVGEFWTKLCFSHILAYSDENLDYLLPKAIKFGKALQLTNILRDIPHDLELGRFYLPCHENIFTDNRQEFLEKLFINEPALIDSWRNKTSHYLDEARYYIQALNNRRVQFACLMPFYIAKETLNSLKLPKYITEQQRIKISRKQIYLYLWKALCFTQLGRTELP